MYFNQKNKYSIYYAHILLQKTHLLLLRRVTGMVKDRFGGMGVPVI